MASFLVFITKKMIQDFKLQRTLVVLYFKLSGTSCNMDYSGCTGRAMKSDERTNK